MDLEVYRLSREIASRIYVLSATFPVEERYSLTDQIRRASRSIGAQIAEAWAKRQYPKHFVSKLTDADGEQFETQHWVLIANDCEYLLDDDRDDLLGKLRSVGRMLQSMKNKADTFCGMDGLRDGAETSWTDPL
jgi:four helix bundle protein